MSPFISRLAALALALGVAGVAVFGVALPLAERHRALGEEIETLQDQLARFEARIAAGAPPQRLVVAEPALFEAPSDAMAAATLQDVLSDVILESGGRLDSVRIESAVDLEEAGRQIPVTLSLTTDMEGLAEILHGIESHRPYLFVEQVEARRRRTGTSLADDTSAEVQEVDLRLRIYGLRRAPEGGE